MPALNGIVCNIAVDQDYILKEYRPWKSQGRDTISTYIEANDGEAVSVNLRLEHGFSYPFRRSNLSDNPTGEEPSVTYMRQLAQGHGWVFEVFIYGDAKADESCFLLVDDLDSVGSHSISGKSVPRGNGRFNFYSWHFTKVDDTLDDLVQGLTKVNLDSDIQQGADVLELEKLLESMPMSEDPRSPPQQGKVEVRTYRAFGMRKSKRLFKEKKQVIQGRIGDSNDPDVIHYVDYRLEIDGGTSDFSNRELIKAEYEDESPFVTFVFHYRSEKRLLQLGLKELETTSKPAKALSLW